MKLKQLSKTIRTWNSGKKKTSKTMAAFSLAVAGTLFSSASAGEIIRLGDIQTTPSVRGIVFYGVDGSDDAGEAVSGAGDVNGDGIADLLIGAKDAADTAPIPDTDYAGEAYLLFGGSDFSSNIFLQAISEDSQPDSIAFAGAEELDGLGYDVTGLGDFNGDGIDDFAISAYYSYGAGNARDYSGESYVIFGSTSGFSGIDITDFADGLSSDGITYFGADEDDYSGTSLRGGGDFNGDGLADMIIGSPGSYGTYSKAPGGPPPGYAAGEIYIIFGNNSTGSVDLGDLENGLTTDTALTVFGSAPLDSVGSRVDWAGDVNGDGYDDVLIGVPYSFATPFGEVFVVFGNDSGLPSFELDDFRASPSSYGVLIEGADMFDQAGYSVSSAGDFNGDGYSDIAISAPYSYSEGNSTPYAGESYIIMGSASLPSTIDLYDVVDGVSPVDAIILYGSDDGDFSGIDIGSGGDLNGDGYSDVLIGTPAADGEGDLGDNSGEVYVIFGKPASGISDILLSSFEDGSTTQGLTIFGVDDDDVTGEDVTGVGDVTGDGIDDFMLGVSESDGYGNSLSGSGEAYLIFGADAPSSATYRLFVSAGDAPNIGLVRDTTSSVPSNRAWADFDGGDNGTGGASLVTTTIIRDSSGVTGLSDLVDVVWEITTTRTAFSNATLTFQYLDSELGSLNESGLGLFRASSINGPWTQVSGQVQDTDRNRISGDVSGFSFFAISDVSADIQDWMILDEF